MDAYPVEASHRDVGNAVAVEVPRDEKTAEDGTEAEPRLHRSVPVAEIHARTVDRRVDGQVGVSVVIEVRHGEAIRLDPRVGFDGRLKGAVADSEVDRDLVARGHGVGEPSPLKSPTPIWVGPEPSK